MTTPLADLHRQRARSLRAFALRLEQLDALTLHRLTGPDTWVGPTPTGADELVRRHRSALLSEVDGLRRTAARLDRMALDAEAVARATTAATGAH